MDSCKTGGGGCMLLLSSITAVVLFGKGALDRVVACKACLINPGGWAFCIVGGRSGLWFPLLVAVLTSIILSSASTRVSSLEIRVSKVLNPLTSSP